MRHNVYVIDTRIKTLKMKPDVGIQDQQKQGTDDSIKEFSIQPHPTYISTLKICMEMYTCYIFNVFYSCSCHFSLAADACLS